MINEFNAEFSQYQSDSASNSLFSRIDDNEFAFVYMRDSASTSSLNSESNTVESLRQFLNKAFGDFLEGNAGQAIEVSRYILNQDDLYPLDVLARTRKQYILS